MNHKPIAAGVREQRTLAVGHLRAASDGSFSLVGTAASYGVLSSDLGGFREQIAFGAFDRSLADPNSDVKCLAQHDPSQILGRQKNGTLKVWSDATGLQFSCKLNPDNSQHRDLYALVKAGTLSDCSFSFTVVQPNGDSWDDSTNPPTRTLRNVNLFDCSVVTNPAYPQTNVDARGKHGATESTQDAARRAACAAISQVVEADKRALTAEEISSHHQAIRDVLAPALAAKGMRLVDFEECPDDLDGADSCWAMPSDKFNEDWTLEECKSHCVRYTYELGPHGEVLFTARHVYDDENLDDDEWPEDPDFETNFKKVCAELRQDAWVKRRMRSAAGIFY
jgi:HK97 family phage prohead protease